MFDPSRGRIVHEENIFYTHATPSGVEGMFIKDLDLII